MAALCPDALLLQYVNPMAINTWALAARFPQVRQVGLCHSVQSTAEELAHDLDLPKDEIDYRVAGINHVAFFLELEHKGRDLYPALRQGYREGRSPKPPRQSRCPNRVRYEVMDHLGYFCTESSEHFAEYTPWFIKDGRPDLIESSASRSTNTPSAARSRWRDWGAQAEAYAPPRGSRSRSPTNSPPTIMNAGVTGAPYVIYGNVANRGQTPQLPAGAPSRRPASSTATACNLPSWPTSRPSSWR